MTTLSSTQPGNINQLNIISFEIAFSRLPTIEYFCQRVNIPAVILGDTFQPTPFLNTPVEGDTLTFEAVNMSFILDEDLQNYIEMYNWMTALGFPREYSQFFYLLILILVYFQFSCIYHNILIYKIQGKSYGIGRTIFCISNIP